MITFVYLLNRLYFSAVQILNFSIMKTQRKPSINQQFDELLKFAPYQGAKSKAQQMAPILVALWDSPDFILNVKLTLHPLGSFAGVVEASAFRTKFEPRLKRAIEYAFEGFIAPPVSNPRHKEHYKEQFMRSFADWVVMYRYGVVS